MRGLYPRRQPLPRLRFAKAPSPTGGEGKALLRRGVREPVRLELVAQRGLEDFSRRGVRNAVDEHDVIRHPPLCNFAIHKFQDVLAARARALLELYDPQRTLVPFRIMDADHGGFRDFRTS